jgi:hypothetical protein
VIERYLDSPPLEPDAPEALRFAAPGRLRGVLGEAGAIALFERLLPFTIDAPLSVEDFWALRIDMSEKLREKIAVLSPKQLSEARGSRSYGRVLDNAGNEFPGPGSYCQRN